MAMRMQVTSKLHKQFKNATTFKQLGLLGAMPRAFFSVDVQKLEMPALSPTMSEGTIIKWTIQEGEKVNVGDILCEIQTDKATIGFESQEEGYLAKILQGDGTAGVPCGDLIGILVEEQDEIAQVDFSEFTSGSGASSQETVQEVPKEEPKKQVQQTTAAKEVDEHQFDKQLHDEIESRKVSPAAGFYLRSYYILPSELTATGPKGYLQKGDVLKYISDNNIQLGDRKPKQTTQQPQAAASQDKPVKTQKKSTSGKKRDESPVFNANKPFQQTWDDQDKSGEELQVGETIGETKKMLAHSFQSVKVDVSSINQQIKAIGSDLVTFEGYVMKAASKAVVKVLGDQKLNVTKVHKDQIQLFEQAQNARISELSSAESHELHHMSGDAPFTSLTVHQVSDSSESLPIVHPNGLISIHYTNPKQEVVSSSAGKVYDIETMELEDLDYSVQMRVSETSKVSVSYDVAKVDDLQAAQFLHQVKTLLDDPEQLLL